jgi:hypothetical protein
MENDRSKDDEKFDGVGLGWRALATVNMPCPALSWLLVLV